MDSENEAKKDKVRVIESDWLWEKILKNMNGKLALTLIYTGAELKATPIEERYIFKANEDEFSEIKNKSERDKKKDTVTKNRDEYYKKMIEMLNKADAGLELAFNNNIDEVFKNELQTLGRSLRVLWKKYESYMRIHDYYSLEDTASYSTKGQGKKEDDDWTDEWGVFMNFENAKIGTSWLTEHHVIFHELFHNIYHAAGLKKMDATENLGNIIIEEVYEILKEEKNKNSATKRLSALTFNEDMKNDEPHKRNKAVLYDIIGAVLYKGKYGCNPANSSLYTEDGKECKYKAGCRPQSENNACNEIFGHNGYWPNDIGKFRKSLAEEAFVQMAAEAIANPRAYKYIAKYLRKSEEAFRKFLKQIIDDMQLSFKH